MQAGVEGFLRSRQSVLWPHEMFAALGNFGQTACFKWILGGNPGKVVEWW